MSQNPEMPLPVNATPNLTTCSNCHSAMPSELRFCRNCGFRLGHGSSDTETIPFRSPSGAVSAPVPAKKRRKMSGMAWVFVGLLAFFVCAAAFTALISPMNRHRNAVNETPVNRSYAGVKDWETTDSNNGATFNAVYPPAPPPPGADARRVTLRRARTSGNGIM